MKKTLILFFLLFITGSVLAQSTDTYQKYFSLKDSIRHSYWQTKEFGKALDLMKEVERDFEGRDAFTKKTYNYVYKGLLYNIACAYSLLNQKEQALEYLKKSVDAGYSNFENLKDDTDFENIKNEKSFLEIVEKLRELGDYKYILKKDSGYKPHSFTVPAFTYQSKDAPELVSFRKKYNLDSIAGHGNEISRFINLMKWVHKAVRHDGNSTNPKNRYADSLIEVCRKENRGINCRMMATILNEAYLSMGFKSRFITCMPKGEQFDDCHVINEVYSEDLKKWIWMDPTFEVYVTDDKGNFLSIKETRERLINDLPVKAYEGINWNGQNYGGGAEKYLHSYMSKNLYRFSIPLNSVAAFENLPSAQRTYIELIPVKYNPLNVEYGVRTKNSIYITDDTQYWRVPAK